MVIYDSDNPLHTARRGEGDRAATGYSLFRDLGSDSVRYHTAIAADYLARASSAATYAAREPLLEEARRHTEEAMRCDKRDRDRLEIIAARNGMTPFGR